MLVAIDIETSCAVPNCDEPQCEHALDCHRNSVTVVGAYTEFPLADGSVAEHFQVFRDLAAFRRWLDVFDSDDPIEIVGHGFKFDYRTLKTKGVDVGLASWTEDTHLMAAVLTEKISDEYLVAYETRRKDLNAAIPRGKRKHREARHHSLKTLAPYFLGVDPFWEDPNNHDNDEYLRRDCQYTYRLHAVLKKKLEEEGSYDFYKNKLMPWTHLLVEMELEGVALDWGLLQQAEEKAGKEAAELRLKLDGMWADAYAAYRTEQTRALMEKYNSMANAAVEKYVAADGERIFAVRSRYKTLFEKAVAKLPHKMNLDSPAQLLWLLRDYFKLSVEDIEGEDSTGKAVLERLAATGRDDLKTFLEYRKQRKLATAFFPTYRELAVNGKILTTFSPTGTRTGRLSSNSPNLQQVPSHLHKMFVAGEGFVFITRDMSGIEPCVIAYYSQDPVLCRLLIEGRNFHSYNTKIVFSLDVSDEGIKKDFDRERKFVKEVALSILYGAGWRRVEASSQKHGFNFPPSRCRETVEMVREEYSGVWKFKEELDATLHSEPVLNLAGRPLRIRNHQDIYMKGFNTLIQGSASDMVWNSAKRIRDAFKKAGIAGGPRLLVHDEVVVAAEAARTKEAEAVVEACMTDYVLDTPHGQLPLKVEGGTAPYWSKG